MLLEKSFVAKKKNYKALSDANILQYKQQQKFTCLILKEAEYLHTYFMHHFCFFQKVFLDAVSADLQIQKNWKRCNNSNMIFPNGWGLGKLICKCSYLKGRWKPWFSDWVTDKNFCKELVSLYIWARRALGSRGRKPQRPLSIYKIIEQILEEIFNIFSIWLFIFPDIKLLGLVGRGYFCFCGPTNFRLWFNH